MTYLIHSSILLGFTALFYWLFLRRETFYRLNRWILLGSVLLSVTLPLISIPQYLSLRTQGKAKVSLVENTIQQTLPVLVQEAPQERTSPQVIHAPASDLVTQRSGIGWYDLIKYLYISGVIIFSLVFVIQLVVLLARRFTLNSVQSGKYTIVELIKDHEPYSFLNSIYINPSSYDQNTYEHIFEHEKVHVDQAHFMDKLVAEVLVIVFWFNPFVWYLRGALSKNLEFLTDQSLLRQGLPKQEYQMSLLKVSTSTKPFNLSTSYNNSFLKNRIMMMNAKNSTVTSYWKYLFILPLFIFSLAMLNAVDQGDRTPSGVKLSNPVQENMASPTENEDKKDGQKMKENISSDHKMQTEVKTQIKKIKPEQESDGVMDKAMNEVELDLPEFSSFTAGNTANVYVTQGNRQKVVVKGPQYLIDKLNKQVNGEHWDINFQEKSRWKNNNYNEDINVYITIKNLRHAGVSGVGNIKGMNAFKVNNDVKFACSGVGNIEMEVHANDISCGVSGAGSMMLKGSGDHFNVAISGSGHVDAPYLSVKTAQMQISGAGNIAAEVSDELRVTISGSGSVKYRGNPKVKKTVSGNGSVVAY